MTEKNQQVLFLMGPTASGKSSLALALYNEFPVEIISVDSALVYKGLDIGTAKPEREITRSVPHHLIDICEPTDSYSAGQFIVDAQTKIKEILNRGKIPLLVGGTGLYFRSLENGIAELPQSDPDIRAQLDHEMLLHGSMVLHDKLKDIDPESAARIHENDPQRIQRALEIYHISGKTMSSLLAEGRRGAIAYKPVKIIINSAERRVIHERIERRFHEMLELGLIEEVEGLYNREDIHEALPAMRMVGYKQVWRYLKGEYDRNKMVELAVIATRQLAKRQLTWLRSEENSQWFEMDESKVLEKISEYLMREVEFGHTARNI